MMDRDKPCPHHMAANELKFDSKRNKVNKTAQFTKSRGDCVLVILFSSLLFFNC